MKKNLRKRDEPAVRAILPDNVYLLRRKSGWNNIETQAEILTLTKHVLGAHLHRFQVIWVCDACKAHFAPEVMRNMSAACFLVLCHSCEIDLAEVAPVAVAAGCTPAAGVSFAFLAQGLELKPCCFSSNIVAAASSKMWQLGGNLLPSHTVQPPALARRGGIAPTLWRRTTSHTTQPSALAKRGSSHRRPLARCHQCAPRAWRRMSSLIAQPSAPARMGSSHRRP